MIVGATTSFCLLGEEWKTLTEVPVYFAGLLREGCDSEG